MTRHDYGSSLNPLNAPSLPDWAAAVAADLDAVVADLGTVMIPGAIIAYGGSAAPTGWHLCDGSAHGSTALQAVIGSATTPDLRGKFILAANLPHPSGQTGGAETHTLTATEMPSHSHAISLEYGGGVDVAQSYPGQYNQVRSAGTGYPTWVWSGIAPEGGGAAHNNMPPYYAVTYIIKT